MNKIHLDLYYKSLILIIFFFISACSSIRIIQADVYFFYKNLKKNPYSTIDFAGHFDNDTVIFFLNDSLIFENKILDSPKISGGGFPTNYVFNIIEKTGKLTIQKKPHSDIEFKEVNIPKYKKKQLKMEIIINQYKNDFTLDISKARYIYIERTSNKTVSVNQLPIFVGYD